MANKGDTRIEVAEIARDGATFHLVGTGPGLLFNSMGLKAQHELLLPKGRKSAAERAGTLKHDPLEEFRASVYTMTEGETLLGFPSPGFKKAMMTAALDIPGAAKAQIGRLVQVLGYRTPIYGIPEIFTTVVRSADIKKTPDIRTRALVPKWAAKVEVSWVTPLLTLSSVTRLLTAAGELAGVGDFRPEKGAGAFGGFRTCEPDDAEFLDIIKHGAREAQSIAMKEPQAYDAETEELLSWWSSEVDRRGRR